MLNPLRLELLETPALKKRLLAALLLAALAPAAPALANEVTSLRHSSEGGKVRMVIDTREPPVYQVFTESSPPRLVVELLDTEPTLERPGRAPSAGVISGWKIEQPTLRRFRWVVNLEAPLPADKVTTLVLDDPHRVVVDVQTAWDSEEAYRLTPGVTWYRRETVGGAGGYLLWNELSFDPGDPHVRLDVGLAKDRLDARETVTSMVRRTQALAGINAGFFASAGGPLGLVVRDGKVLSPHVGRRPPRTVLGVTDDKEIRFDRVAARGQQLSSRGGQDWTDVVIACGGGPRLLHRGQVSLTTDEEGLGPKGNDITRVAGRTAVGLTADGKMMMVTAAGYRDTHTQGMRLEQLAVAMLRRGAREAMNFDGGASVDMAIGGKVVSSGPGSRTKEKPVATALLLFDDRPATGPDRMMVEVARERLPADGKTATEIVARVRTAAGGPVADGTPVVFEVDGAPAGARAVTRNGEARVKLTSVRAPGNVKVRARSGAAEALGYVKMEAGDLARLVTRLEPKPTPAPSPRPAASPSPSPSPAPALRQMNLTVLAEDAWFNGLSRVPVAVSVDGQAVGAFPTESDGEARILLSLPQAACEVVVSAPGAPPVRLPVAAASE